MIMSKKTRGTHAGEAIGAMPGQIAGGRALPSTARLAPGQTA
jgi:hypothetical protein